MKIDSMQIPTKQDFYFDGSNDERYAIELFEGKSINDVVKMCISKTPLALGDVFYHVGIKAFRYYVFAFFEYIKLALNSEDKEMIFEAMSLLSCIIDIIKQHISNTPNEIIPITSELNTYLQFIKNHKYILKDYKNLNHKIVRLIKILENMQ